MLFAMIILSSGVSNAQSQKPVNYIFTSCANDQGSFIFDATTNVVTVVITVKNNPPYGVRDWKSVRLNWYCDLVTNNIEGGRRYDTAGITIDCKIDQYDLKRGDMYANGKVLAVKYDEGKFTYRIKISDEQVTFLKSLNALPDNKTAGFAFGLLTSDI